MKPQFFFMYTAVDNKYKKEKSRKIIGVADIVNLLNT